MDFGRFVRQARKAKGLTLLDLANAVGSSPNNVWELETRNSGSMDLLARVSARLGLEWTGIARGKSLGTRIKNRRLRLGWSATKLAEKSGVSISAVGRVEMDRGHISTAGAIVKIIAPNFGANFTAARWGKMPGTRDNRFTPPEFLREIEFVLGGDICLDPCGHPNAAVRAQRIFTEDDDGLTRPWDGKRIYANPPYSNAAVWMRRGHRAWADGEAERVLMLLPTQTHTRAFHGTPPTRTAVRLG